ncbi:MAG: Uma2 family endonuclease [Candidatus Tectomicrobia bacterium]|uniref:Uma2 family endonuclease n=1 Tax=Tectimicrobiota bacterium TaxID=2528274 RepID=A0A937VZR5_UNCTE|nr:Uma2 family endonuclease [Candidatus Tectomicrobia bacterium]
MVYVTTAYALPCPPDTSHLITEDDTPVDNLASEKHQRLLTEPLYSSWAGPGPGRTFLVAANVGLFVVPRNPAIVPDVMLSLDVTAPEDWWAIRSYFVWEYGKTPDVVIEIVSNTKGGEKSTKRTQYAQAGIPYYVVYDPDRYLPGDVLEVYELLARAYRRRPDAWLPEVGLGVTLWEGMFEGRHGTWLRWCDQAGEVIPTGAERAEAAQQQAEAAQQRAEAAQQRAERLARRLRELGLDPEEV